MKKEVVFFIKYDDRSAVGKGWEDRRHAKPRRNPYRHGTYKHVAYDVGYDTFQPIKK